MNTVAALSTPPVGTRERSRLIAVASDLEHPARIGALVRLITRRTDMAAQAWGRADREVMA